MMQAVGIIADIVDSREMVDRSAGQRAITDAFAEAETAVSPIRPAWATVGDEFQVIVATWQDSLRLTLRMQALLPDGIQLRYGIGAGQINTIEQGESGPIQDGTAWLSARAAIDEVEARQQRRDDVMSGFCSDDVDLATAVSAQLMVRDHVLGRMKARERRLLSALLFGATQQEAARNERISQAAVSQTLHRSGAMALLDVDDMLAVSSDSENSKEDA
ncbi:MAG: hypothetical protein GX920_01615 [Micrococcus sp.]|nr:hypothetical protein [Micrococcus sp.]